ncbi:MAG: AMP-binding protein [Myxococcota bacterium]|nr:AMP-binding protein [Myxococcota bacterium]
MTRLSELLHNRTDDGREIARRHGMPASQNGSLTLGEFRDDVGRLYARLAYEGEGPWLLLTEDAYAFAVGLFALWHAGRHAILPPNSQIPSLKGLQTRATGVLTDRADWFPTGSPLHPLFDADPTGSKDLPPIHPSAFSVEMFTSGTTGDAKTVTKRISHLEEELIDLESVFGPMIGSSRVYSTASHQHLYGLLFSVLWPLCSARSFDPHHYLHPGELIPRLLADEHSTLVSVPTFLSRFVRHPQSASLKHCKMTVFSSGGMLPSEVAQKMRKKLGHPAFEVLGSTETGGVAWRVQNSDSDESAWQPLGRVTVRREESTGVLRVLSPYVTTEEGQAGHSTGDRIEWLPEGGFRLLGRTDRVVKVGEKRVDLEQMASQIRSHEWVEAVELTTVVPTSDPRVAGVVVASAKGRRVLQNEGRRRFLRALRECLVDDWDPVLHPRSWRFVRRLPEDTQGKVTQSSLRALFGGQDSSSGGSDRPERLSEQKTASSIKCRYRVPEDLDCFLGHFPGLAIVPGVLQFDWIMELAVEVLPNSATLSTIKSIKFVAPLAPNDEFEIALTVEPLSSGDQGARSWQLSFTLSKGDVPFTMGRADFLDSTADRES